MKRNVLRVVRAMDGKGWRVRLDGGRSVGRLCGLQDEAVRWAAGLARGIEAAGGRAQVVLHGRDGRIRWERSYPDDTPQRRG